MWKGLWSCDGSVLAAPLSNISISIRSILETLKLTFNYEVCSEGDSVELVSNTARGFERSPDKFLKASHITHPQTRPDER